MPENGATSHGCRHKCCRHRCCHRFLSTENCKTFSTICNRQVVLQCCRYLTEVLSSGTRLTPGCTLDHAVPSRSVETMLLWHRSTEMFPPWKRCSPPLCGNENGIEREQNSNNTCSKLGATTVHLNTRISQSKKTSFLQKCYEIARLAH